MLGTLYSIASFIVALGLLIIVHEFGHYWVAKKAGVKVLRFSVGFGRPLYTRVFGKDRTEFVVAAFPLGGYVKMLDETEGPVAASEIDRAFNRKSLPKRAAVVAAGPAFNLAFAVLAYWAVFVSGVDGLRPVVGHVVADSPAARSGLQVGDELLSVDGKDTQTWSHRRLYLFNQVLGREPVVFRVRSANGLEREATVDTSSLSISSLGPSLMGQGLGIYVRQPELLPIVGALQDGPAQRAGLQPGDRIIYINGAEIKTWQDMATLIHGNPGKELAVTYVRGAAQKRITLVPDLKTIEGKEIGLIGIAPQYPEVPPEMIRRLQYGLFPGLAEAVDQTWLMSSMSLKMLGKMLTREVSTENISGPITIAQYAGQSASIGLTQFIVFLAVISISLGVLNLLPIPVLDGGHLMYYAIEAIKGSPVSDQARIFGQQVGVILLIMLMMLAFYNDIIRIIN